MNMPLRKIRADRAVAIPAKMRMLLLHVRRSERDKLAAQPTLPVANDPEPSIIIEPIAHRRMS